MDMMNFVKCSTGQVNHEMMLRIPNAFLLKQEFFTTTNFTKPVGLVNRVSNESGVVGQFAVIGQRAVHIKQPNMESSNVLGWEAAKNYCTTLNSDVLAIHNLEDFYVFQLMAEIIHKI